MSNSERIYKEVNSLGIIFKTSFSDETKEKLADFISNLIHATAMDSSFIKAAEAYEKEKEHRMKCAVVGEAMRKLFPNLDRNSVMYAEKEAVILKLIQE